MPTLQISQDNTLQHFYLQTQIMIVLNEWM